MKRAILLLLALVLTSPATFAQTRYEKPPQAILDVRSAPLTPVPLLSPTYDTVVLAQPLRYPPISDLAEPMLRLAGLRVNPRTNAERSYPFYLVGLSLQRLPGGAETPIAMPPGARIGFPTWNATGKMFAFTNETADRVELWVTDVATGKARQLPGLRINALLGYAVEWMPDQKTLLVKLVPGARGVPPQQPAAPPAPKIQESSGVSVASSTYEARDLLKSAYDADLFDYYATSQLALVDVVSGKVTRIGKPAIFQKVVAAPGGRYVLVERIHRPYSYLRAHERFPKEIEVWTTGGELVESLASLPLAEQVPIGGVATGPRNHSWRPTEPATVVWAEALDGGNPKTKAPYRDRVMLKPVGGTGRQLCKLEQRFAGSQWIESGGIVLVSEYDRDRLWTRTFIVDAGDPAKPSRLLWDMSVNEKYRHPGYPVYHVLPTGSWMVMRHKDWIYLRGSGASPEGDRPFLDRLDLNTLKTERLFRSERSCLEMVIGGLRPVEGTFFTRRESPVEPPNVFLRTLGQAPRTAAPAGEAAWPSTAQAITHFPDPTPQLRGITKRLVTYKRADGVPLSFTLYLPPGYKPGTRLPTVFWAYPLDYAEKEEAGQIEGSTQRFTTMAGTSVLFFLLEGYAVLDNVAMPVVGPPESVYNTFVEQIVANAKAAIDKAVALGVTDRERVGVAGHSHGALMTANLLAYCDLFRAGIARSGAYNHTMRPFGFQNERRTLWQARDVYLKLSPVLQADKIHKPLLLIHGELDQNPGTVPLQSEKLFEAIRGVGGTVRLVVLPYESHGYMARESTEHVLYEMLSWFDRYVKAAPPH